MPDSYLSRPGGQINPQRSMIGVRHISEELIKNTVKDTALDSITILKLNFSELSGKKIRVIENLEKLKRLHTLNLAHNSIERLERLEALVRLKDLDVSHNHVTKIEGLEKLVNLISLNVEGNEIQTIPVWLCKKLKALRNLRLASNNIEALQEIRKLRGLPNLTFLTVAHNPICELPHYRLYIIFHLRGLDVLDGRRITPEERVEAARRFDQEEIEALHSEVNEMQHKFDRLQEDHNKSLRDLENSQLNDSQLLRATKENSRQIRDLQAELHAKEEMIGRKQAELSRANLKHYELEQELAFYKIDTKFTSLHKKPDTPSLADDADSLVESPYIGKSQHAKDRPQWPASLRSPNKKSPQRRRGSDTSPDSLLESELEQKQREVEEADRKLADLTAQLQHTEKRVTNAAEHLVKLTDLVNRTREPIPDNEREDMERKLDALQQTIDELENNREQLLDNLDKNAADISEAEQNLDDLDRSLDASDLDDSEKEALLLERDDKEAFLVKAKEMRDDLEQALADLEQVLEQKKAEAQVIDQQITTAPGDSLGTESNPDIGNVAREVKDILASLKQGQATESEGQILRKRLADLEKIAEERERERQKLEQSLREERSAREQLEHSRSPSSPSRVSLTDSMRAAPLSATELEEDVRRLLELKDKLEHELRNSAAAADPSTKKELAKLKKENDKLKRDSELGRTLADAEVLAKLDSAIQRAQSGQPITAGTGTDPVQRKLATLQQTVEQEKRQAERDAKKLRDENARLQLKVGNLNTAISAARAKEDDSTDSESSLLVEALKRELQDIRSNMTGEDNLKKQLAEANERLRKAHAEIERARQMSRATDQPRHSPSKFDRYSVPPQFDLDGGLDESYDSESTRDTVRHGLPQPRRQGGRHDEMGRGSPGHRHDDVDRGSPGHTANSQNSGRATDEVPRMSGPPKQSVIRAPPHPDDAMSIQSEVPVPYGQPRYPDGDGHLASGRSSRPGDRRWAPGRDLGTVPETYESDLENPRQGVPKPNKETRKMQKELARADGEIDRLQQILAARDRDLDNTLRRTDEAEDVIAKQKDESDRLKRELDLYRKEVDRLAALLANQGRLGDEDMIRINSLRPNAQTTSGSGPPSQSAHMSAGAGQPPQFAHMSGGAGPPPQFAQSGMVQSQSGDYAQMSASFMQGPSFRPGQLGSSPLGHGQMMTSTPHRGYQVPQQQPQPPQQLQPLQQPASYQQAPANILQTHSALPIAANQMVPGPTGAYTVQSQPVISNAQPQALPLAQSQFYHTGATSQPIILTAPSTVTLVPANTVSGVTVAPTTVTPTKTVLLHTSLSTTPVKSILKTSERNGLVCVVPEHHDLEDQHARLRDKYKALKSSLKRTASEHKEERKLAGHAKAASELKHALKERRSELESLDLAINMQREQLHTLKSNWRLTRRDRSGSNRRPSPDMEDDEEGRSETEHYMNTELQCLEETLAKRRAELREADKRLIDCRNDLELVKDEAEQMISQYDLIKGQLDTAQTELEVLEGGKGDREGQVAQLMVNIKTLSEDRDKLQQQIDQIEEVTKDRDAYFNTLNQKIQQSEGVLSELQVSIRQQTADAEQNLHEIKLEAERHLSSVRQSESELSEHFGDIRDIKSVLSEREQQLSSVNTDLGTAKQELSLVQTQTDEQKTTLQGLETEVKVITERLKDKRIELGSLNSIEREMKERLEGRKELLDKVKDRIEDEKEALQTLTIAVEQKEDQLSVLKKSLTAARAESSELLREISERRCLLESLTAESNVVERELNELRAKHTEGRQLLDKLEFETNSSSNVLEKLQVEKETVSRAVSQKAAELEQQTKKLESHKGALAEMSNTQHQIEAQIREKTSEYELLESRMRQLQAQIDDSKFDKNNCESELHSVAQSLKEQKATASKLKKVMKDMETKRNSLSTESESLEKRKHEMEQQLNQFKYEYQQVSNVLMEAKAELNEQQIATGELREDVGRLNEERNERQRSLKELTNQYDRESQQLNDMTERAERELSHMRDQQQVCQTRVGELTRELSRLMSEINKNRKEHGDLTQLRSKLEQSESELEAERTTNADLMKRLTEFAQRLQTRNDSLTKVKKQSEGHIQSLSEELTQVKKECKALRGKREVEIEDLEWIAQQHAQRADRLNAELVSAHEQIEILKRNIMSLELQTNKEEKLAETITHLKEGIQQEVTMGMAELERSRAEAVSELDQLRAQKAFIANEVIALKENLDKVQSRQLDCQRIKPRSPSPRKSASTASVRRKLDAEQEIIRMKMNEQMQRHLDSMEGMKSHSMNILTDLQDRVSSLQGVLSESTASIQNTPSPPHRPVRDTH